jgi:type 1 glutamine amidotransferase
MKSFFSWLSALALLAVNVFTASAQVSEADLKKVEAALPSKAPVQVKTPRKILVYSKTLGFRHGSIPIGVAAIKAMGEKTGAYTIEHSEDPAMFDENRLSKFDAVLFLNTTGDCLAPKNGKLSPDEQATLEQRQKNLIDFVKSGKGFAGIHSATDTFYGWKEYGDLIGAYFTNHPWGDIPLKVDSPNHPLTSMFDASGFSYKDEIYHFGKTSRASKYDGYQPYSREKLRVLLSIDASKFGEQNLAKGDRPDNDFAISWIREYGKGRVFYCVLGHSNHTYWNENVLQHYLTGLQYVLGDLQADATPSAAVKQ